MNHQAMERVTLEQDLREALKGDEILLQYQPQVALNGTALRGLACDDQQGHLISRPLDPDGCIAWMGRA